MYRILIVLIVLISIVLVVEPVNANECYPNEHCYTMWQFESEKYCAGGTYTLDFCYLPSDPGNGDYHHYHAKCSSSIVPPVIHLIALPIVMR